MEITAEQFKEFLETEEGGNLLQEIVSNAITEGGYKSSDDVQGLVDKNKQLLGKLKKAKESSKPNKLDEESTKMLDILEERGILSSDELIDFVEPTQGKPPISTDNLKFKRRIKELETQNADMQSYKALAESERQLRVSSEKKAVLTTALKNARVKDDSFEMSYAYFNNLTVSEFDDEGNVSFVAKDKDGLSPSIDSFIEDWSKTDNAQAHIQKPVNSGAGNLLNGKSSKPTMSRAEYNQVPAKQQHDTAMKYDIVD